MHKKQIIIELDQSWYGELKEIADKHVCKPTDMAERFIIGCIKGYLKRSKKEPPLLTDLNKES